MPAAALDVPVHVWGTGTPRTLRVYWALYELGLPYVRHPLRTRTSDMEQPAFRRLSPAAKIPAIEHGDLRLSESAAIVDYLYALAGVTPPSLALSARIEQWTSFALMELDATALYVLRRHKGLPEIYGEAPMAVSAAVDYFARQAAVVAAELNDGREFIAGEALSKADIVLVTCCQWARFEALDLPSPLGPYCDRLLARSAAREARAANRNET